MSCTALHRSKASLLVALAACLPPLHHADNTRVCFEPSDPTCPSPRRPPGRPEDSCSGIVLAYTGSSFSAAAALTLRDWGWPARGAAGQRRQRSAVFLARPSARSERRRSVAAEIQLEGCWARGPPTPPSQPKRDFPRRLKQPATSARRSDRGDLNSKSPRRAKRAAARK